MTVYQRLPELLECRRVSGADRRTKPGQVRPAVGLGVSYGDFGFGLVCAVGRALRSSGAGCVSRAHFP